MIVGRSFKAILATLFLWLSLAAAMPGALPEGGDVAFVPDSAPAHGSNLEVGEVFGAESSKEGFTIEKRANPSGHLSIPARRSPIPSSVVIGAVKVIAYYTVQGAIEIYVQNLARHASPYSVRHAPGGIIDGIVPGGVGRQDVYNNPSNFFPGDVLEISAVPK
ncbi:hypothetical protein B9Z65_7362 [Elsinoe australis]|uniref:Uncharacterized protein n=1 Tax=Elsinoe australis TaxID=40998 RepID=A0A2P7YBY3_9PEZI|nr:hypothetical protein B9Z65_7362 [Elsinoe australis]